MKTNKKRRIFLIVLIVLDTLAIVFLRLYSSFILKSDLHASISLDIVCIVLYVLLFILFAIYYRSKMKLKNEKSTSDIVSQDETGGLENRENKEESDQ